MSPSFSISSKITRNTTIDPRVQAGIERVAATRSQILWQLFFFLMFAMAVSLLLFERSGWWWRKRRGEVAGVVGVREGGERVETEREKEKNEEGEGSSAKEETVERNDVGE